MKFISTLTEFSEGKKYSAEWKSPSNIALVKYWGKYYKQIPANPSISFTLTNCHTKTRVSIISGDPGVDFLYDGKPAAAFASRIEEVIISWLKYFPFLYGKRIEIDTVNSFPHSAGIASSASAMSALALCICDIEQQLGGLIESFDFYQKASFIARLGSGSAARSLFPVAALWGHIEGIEVSSNEFAIPVDTVHTDFLDYRDTVLIVDPSIKEVSSSKGHQLMQGHPFARERFLQAETHSRLMLEILREGRLRDFSNLVEREALTLHAMMLSSDPGFILMNGDTLRIIQKIREFREQTGIAVCFTLDAGPNVHLLYPGSSSDTIINFINRELLPYCYEGKMIHDKIGKGPEKLSASV